MPYWFFLSYARLDRDKWLDQFFADLCDEVGRKSPVALPPAEIGFRDTRSIEPGQEWEPELADALRTSRLCLCLCSPRYLDSTYCGKEYRVFCERYDACLQNLPDAAPRPRVIFPLRWEWLPDGVPSILSRFQYSHESYPDVYAQQYLRYIMKLSRHTDDYRQFVDHLARTLVRAGTDTPLPELPRLRPLRQVDSAFHPLAPSATGTEPATPAGGPSVAKFIFLAAAPNQLRNIRTSLDSYDNQGGWYWRPYLPTTDESVGMMAQAAALKLKFRYVELSLGNDLVRLLRAAESRNEVVVLLVDPWSVRLEPYGTLMGEYDGLTLANSAVLVPWNENDAEARSGRTVLEQALRSAFPRKYLLRPPRHYWDSIRSAPELSSALEEALSDTRMTIIQLGQVKRRAESMTLTREAQEQGIHVETMPNITGPVGGLG